MTPEERAAALIGRIDATTDTESLARMIAAEIQAAVEERDAPAGPPVSVALEPPRRIGRATLGRPEGAPTEFRIVRHPAYAYMRDAYPAVRGLELGCYICGVDEPEPGKVVLYYTDDGYHCEACVYDEYVHFRTKHLSLFAVQYQTLGEIKDAVREDIGDTEGVEEVDEGLVGRLAAEIARDLKEDEYLKPFPDIISMLMRRVYYRVMRRHENELPAGYEHPGMEF